MGPTGIEWSTSHTWVGRTGITIILLVIAVSNILASEELREARREYCQWEVFNATCGADEVVLMESAAYGRMRLGRCLQRDYGYVGCSYDVLKYVDSKCSGRHKCTFTVPDPVLDMMQPCPGDLKGYMEASYTCLRVETGDGHLCRGPIPLTEPSGYIASVVTQDMQLGSVVCPWVIQASRGQRIVITLLDFSLWTEADNADLASSRSLAHRPPESSGICHIYAQIRENTAATAVTLCGGERRKKVVYTSESETVRVVIANAQARSYFLLQYEVTGCPEIPSSSNLVVDRYVDSATVTCKSSGESWELTCGADNLWSGKPKNCTDVKAWGLTDLIENAISLPQGVLIVIILGIALFIAVIILTVGLWTLRRRQHDPPRDKDTSLVATSGSHNYSGRRSLSEAGTKEHYPMLANPERAAHERRGESEYTSTWQRRAQVPASRVFPDGTLHRMEYDRQTLERARGARCPPYTLQTAIGRSAVDTPPPPPPPPPPSSSGPHFAFGAEPPEHHVEHIYESPKFERRHGRRYDEYGDGPFYHELDPDRLSTTTSSSQPDLVLNPETIPPPPLPQTVCGSGPPGIPPPPLGSFLGGQTTGGGWPDPNANIVVLDDSGLCQLNEFPPAPSDLPPPNLNNLA